MFPRRDLAFTRVAAGMFPDGGFFVQWWVSPTYKFASEPEFYIDIATATDNWQRLNPGSPVRNGCMYVGAGLARCGSTDTTFLRVAAADSEGETLSMPTSIYGELTRHDFLISRDIVRKEYLRLKKYAGTEGILFKRKFSGTKCPACTDYDVENSPMYSQCPVCYGTGYTGGYYNGFPFFIDIGNDNSSRDITPPFGTTDMQVRTGRCVGYPSIETYDMWMQRGTGKRYIVRKTQITAALKTAALIYTLELHAIPFSGIEYKVPETQALPPYPDLPAESSETGWRSGIGYTVN